MNPIRYLGVALLFVLGCQAVPTVTRTGDVKDIIIGDNLTSSETAVNTGDEVRWVNKRTQPVRVIFLDAVSDKQLSCKNNVGGWMTSSDTAYLDKNEAASVCFRDPGYFRYIIRMESSKTTGDINVQGVIKVGVQGGQAAGQTSDKTSSPRSSTSTTTSTTTTTEGTSGPITDQTKPPQ